MNFNLTPEQQVLKDSVRRFCAREYPFEARNTILRGDGFSRAYWASFAELGWLGAGLAEDKGGYGGGAVENAVILEEMGRALVLEPFLPCAVGAAQALAALPHGEAVQAQLEAIVSGESIAVLAHDDRGETQAEKAQSGWRLAGAKRFVLGAPAADVFLVSAHTKNGLSLFRVPRGAPGLCCRNYRAVDGRRVSDLTLENCDVGQDALLGSEGGTAQAIELAQDHLLAGLCAEAIGAMDAALWLTRDYLKTRKQFGVTLNTFQALQHRMANMLVEVELARSMLYRALGALTGSAAAERRRTIAAAKAQIGEAGYFVGAEAVQLHGGIGVTEEYIAAHYFKRLTLVRGLYGASDLHLMRFAQLSRSAP